MKIEQLVAVLVRFFVTYFMLVIIFQYGMTLAALVMQNQKIGVAGNGLIYATFAIVALLLVLVWVFALPIAKFMTPKGGTEIAAPVSIEKIEVVGISLLGLWLVVSSIPDLVQYGVYISSVDFASKRTSVSFYGNIAEFVVGIALLFGSGVLVTVLDKLRREI